VKLNCPNCDRWIPTENVNLQRGFAVCHLCQQVFRLAKIVPRKFSKQDLPLPVPKPRNFEVAETKGEIIIRQSWYRPWVWILVPLAIVAAGVLIAIMFTVASDPEGPGPIGFFLPLLVPHTWLVLAFIYASFTMLLNKTIVQVRNDEVAVSHRPIFYWGNYVVPVHDIQQFYCSERQGRWSSNWRPNQYSQHFDLNALLTDGSKLRLLTLEQVDEALFIEQELERHLHIADRLVTGEVKTLRTPRL